MERLTDKAWGNLDPWECCGQDHYCQRGCHDAGGCTKGCIVPRLYKRLARYEDTGMEPGEIKDIVGLFHSYRHICAGIDPDHLRELAQAEKDGRLAVLPYKPDATAYQWKKGDDIPSMFRLSGVGIDEDGEITYQTHWGETFTPDDFGKTVFLTREEAEAVLKKREEADNETD